MKRADITEIFPDATKEQIDKIMDLSGTEATKAKKDLADLQEQLTAAQNKTAELEKNGKDLKAAQDRALSLETELNGLKTANKVREIREAVAKETGVPVSLITADTEDACKTQAQGILEYAKSGNYPAVKDGGEINPASGGAAATGLDAAWQSFAAQINQT